jgi:hypothetical protein
MRILGILYTLLLALALPHAVLAEGFDVFLLQREKIAGAINFDAQKHIGASCKFDQLASLPKDSASSLKHLKLDFEGGQLTAEVLDALQAHPQIETIMLLRFKIQRGDTGKLLQILPSLRGYVGFTQQHNKLSSH